MSARTSGATTKLSVHRERLSSALPADQIESLTCSADAEPRPGDPQVTLNIGEPSASEPDPVTPLDRPQVSTELHFHDCPHEAADATRIPHRENDARPGQELKGSARPKPGDDVAAPNEGHGHATAQVLRDVSEIGERDEQDACPQVVMHSNPTHVEASYEPTRHADANANAEAQAHDDATPSERSGDQEHQELVVSGTDPTMYR